MGTEEDDVVNITVEAQDFARVEACEELGVESTSLNGKVVELTLLVTLPQDVLLNGVLSHQAVDVHLACLTDAVAPILSLYEQMGPWSRRHLRLMNS